MKLDWINNIKNIRNCGNDLALLADLCGEDIAKNVAMNMAGVPLYIPNTVLKKLRKQYIIEQYDGTRQSIKRAAIETGITSRYAQEIITKHLQSKKSDIQPNQAEDK